METKSSVVLSRNNESEILLTIELGSLESLEELEELESSDEKEAFLILAWSGWHWQASSSSDTEAGSEVV